MTVLVVFEALVILVLAMLVIGLLRSHAEILRALHDLGVNMEDGAPESGPRTFRAGSRGDAVRAEVAARGVLPAGTPVAERVGDELALPADGPLGDAHDLMGVTPRGDGVAISMTDADQRVLLAFLTSGCQSCLDFWQAFELERNRQVAGARSRLIVLTKGPDQESPGAVAELCGFDLEVVMSTESFDDYSVPIAPYFVLLDRGRVVGEGAASTFDQLGSLMSKALTDAGYGSGATRDRRELLRGRRRPSADEALRSAGIGPGHPSLHSYPAPHRDGDPESGGGSPWVAR
jgi:hypothetical protein